MRIVLFLFMFYSFTGSAQFRKKPAAYFTHKKTGEIKSFQTANYCYVELKNKPQNDSLFPPALDPKNNMYCLKLQSQIGEVLVFENNIKIPYSEIKTMAMRDSKVLWRKANSTLMLIGVGLTFAFTYNKVEFYTTIIGMPFILKELLQLNIESINCDDWILNIQQVPELLFKTNLTKSYDYLPPLNERYEPFKN